jgi:hypothetical protein
MKHAKYNAGLDLSSIAVKDWLKLLTLNGGLQWTNRKHDGCFVFGFKSGYIVTCNEPLGGEYYRTGLRSSEIGYLSYVGITGTKRFRNKTLKFLLKHTEHKDYNATEREYV